MHTVTHDQASVLALLTRAERLANEPGLQPATAQFWRGYAKGLKDLQFGIGRRLALRDQAKSEVDASQGEHADADAIGGHDAMPPRSHRRGWPEVQP